MRVRGYDPVVEVSGRSEAEKIRTYKSMVLIRDAHGPRWLQFNCPCGCGEAVWVNLRRGAGPAWSLRVDNRGQVSLWPSVVRNSGCMSHFVLHSGRAYVIADDLFAP